ncbi:hypothetical protein K435DRAFT_874859 [Dendrothele bispora CBS 962.96]|uniref:Uncharacterized protein n=1 Tax=Dendrothele bispora (strain CBS 962.96) TaxID=1314807 RepID=A0A4S8KVL5_DENBC|nr:hypothetical protein K435DRAFT_874859 [Dendrothele bispora CBS 962.96]
MSTRVQTETETNNPNNPNEGERVGPTAFHTLTPQGVWANRAQRQDTDSISNLGRGGRMLRSPSSRRNNDEEPIEEIRGSIKPRMTQERRTHRVQPQLPSPEDPIIRHIRYQSHPYAGDLFSYQIRRAEGLTSEDSFPRMEGPSLVTPSIEQAVREEENSLTQSRKEESIASEEKDGEKEREGRMQSTAEERTNPAPIALPRTIAPQPYYAQTPQNWNSGTYRQQYEAAMGSAFSRPPHWSEPRSLPPPYPVDFSSYRNPSVYKVNNRGNRQHTSDFSDTTPSTILQPYQTPTEAFAMLGARSREFARNLGHEGHRYLTHKEAINYVRELAEGHWEHLSEDAINVLRTPMYQEEMRRIYVATMDQGISSILRDIKEQRDSQRGGNREVQEPSRHVSPHHISDLAPSEEEQLLWEGTHRYQELTGEAVSRERAVQELRNVLIERGPSRVASRTTERTMGLTSNADTVRPSNPVFREGKEKEGKETKDRLVASTSTVRLDSHTHDPSNIDGYQSEFLFTPDNHGNNARNHEHPRTPWAGYANERDRHLAARGRAMRESLRDILSTVESNNRREKNP